MSAARTRTRRPRVCHQKAIAAIDAGRFDAELAPVTVRDAKGRETVVSIDEGPRRDSTIEALARLKPAFALPEGEDRGSATTGTVTAGNAPGITDGAAATVVASERAVERLGLTPLARIVGYAQAEVEPKWLFLAPIEGVRRLLDRIELPIEALDLIEINEAFAAQTLADGRALGFDWARVNVNGGAIALGHRSGRPARGSSRRCSTSWLDATAATGSPRCASAVAVRSPPRSSASDRVVARALVVMRLVVLGAGGIGAYYGAGFAKGGAEVTLVARGAHLAAIRDHGLTVTTADGTERHQLRAPTIRRRSVRSTSSCCASSRTTPRARLRCCHRCSSPTPPSSRSRTASTTRLGSPRRSAGSTSLVAPPTSSQA